MNVITIESEAFQTLMKKAENLQNRNEGSSNQSPIQWMNNERFCDALGISKRTAQNYRDQGVIPFSMVKGKVYYRITDIDKLMSANYSSNNNRNYKKAL